MSMEQLSELLTQLLASNTEERIAAKERQKELLDRLMTMESGSDQMSQVGDGAAGMINDMSGSSSYGQSFGGGIKSSQSCDGGKSNYGSVSVVFQ